MNWATLKKRFGVRGGGVPTGKFVAPSFALELEQGFVAAARLSTSKRQVLSLRVSDLPTGALSPSANKSNMTDIAAVRHTLTELTARIGNGGGKIGLLIPDVAVRVALLQFETLPGNRQEAETLVLWRMREYLPYAPEEARLTYQVLSSQPGAIEVLGVAVRSSVLSDYESVLEGVNGGPILVLPATIALLPLLPEDTGGQLLLHLSPGALTAVVVASNRVRYWRTRTLDGEVAGNMEEIARESTRVLATCQDNLAVQVENVWFCGRPPAAVAVEQALAKALGRELSALPADFARGAAIPAEQFGEFGSFGIPFAGLLANIGERR